MARARQQRDPPDTVESAALKVGGVRSDEMSGTEMSRIRDMLTVGPTRFPVSKTTGCSASSCYMEDQTENWAVPLEQTRRRAMVIVSFLRRFDHFAFLRRR